MQIKRQNIPLNALRVFETVARQQNMARAADELCVTHSAVSQQVRKLEDLLNARLFDRSHKPLRLTAKGESLLASVTHGLDILARGTGQICHGEIDGEVNVSCVPGLGANWFVHMLGEFMRSHDKVRFRVFTEFWQQPGQREEVDLAIIYGSADHPGKRVTRLGHPEFFPVCSPQLLNTRHVIRHASELLGYTLLHDHGEDTWARWFAATGVEGQGTGRNLIFDSAHLSLQAARTGHGIALADAATVQKDLIEGRLIRLLSQSIPATHPYYIVTPPADRLNPAVLALETWLLEQYRMIERKRPV